MVIFMVMMVRYSVWSALFCSVTLPTSKVMFRYLALHSRLSLLYSHVWLSSVMISSVHIPCLRSFTLFYIAYPIPFLYPHPCLCSVVSACTHRFVLSCSVRYNPMSFTWLTLHSFLPFCQKLWFCFSCPSAPLPCLRFFLLHRPLMTVSYS